MEVIHSKGCEQLYIDTCKFYDLRIRKTNNKKRMISTSSYPKSNIGWS
jgi:hypothetical protein